MYLAITNKGTTDYRALITIGMSSSRYSANDDIIGQFGSGFKHALALFIRKGMTVVVCIGNLKIIFKGVKEETNGRMYTQIYAEFSGSLPDGKVPTKIPQRLNLVAEWGIDWTELDMGVREVVSNALDAQLENAGNHEIEMSVEEKPRAAKDYTTVYIPFTSEICDIYGRLSDMFLHRKDRNLLKQTLIPKQRPGYVTIYKKGVRAAQFAGESTFDYNLAHLELDECRNATESQVESAIKNAIGNATEEQLVRIFQDLNKNTFESKLDRYGWYSLNKDRFKSAWSQAMPYNSVPVNDGMLNSFIEAKGYKPTEVPNAWVSILHEAGIPTVKNVLDHSEQKGIKTFDATSAMTSVCKQVWELLLKHNKTHGKPFPLIKAFDKPMENGVMLKGYMANNVVFLHQALGHKELYQTALEEVVHYATGCADCSRQLQEFLFSLIVEMQFEGMAQAA